MGLLYDRVCQRLRYSGQICIVFWTPIHLDIRRMWASTFCIRPSVIWLKVPYRTGNTYGSGLYGVYEATNRWKVYTLVPSYSSSPIRGGTIIRKGPSPEPSPPAESLLHTRWVDSTVSLHYFHSISAPASTSRECRGRDARWAQP